MTRLKLRLTVTCLARLESRSRAQTSFTRHWERFIGEILRSRERGGQFQLIDVTDVSINDDGEYCEESRVAGAFQGLSS